MSAKYTPVSQDNKITVVSEDDDRTLPVPTIKVGNVQTSGPVNADGETGQPIDTHIYYSFNEWPYAFDGKDRSFAHLLIDISDKTGVHVNNITMSIQAFNVNDKLDALFGQTSINKPILIWDKSWRGKMKRFVCRCCSP